MIRDKLNRSGEALAELGTITEMFRQHFDGDGERFPSVPKVYDFAVQHRRIPDPCGKGGAGPRKAL